MAAPFTLDSLPPEVQQALVGKNPYAAPPQDPREAAIAGLLQGANEAVPNLPGVPDWRLSTILPEDIKESLGIRSTAPPPPAATTPQGQSQQEWQAGIEAQRQAALAKHGAPQGRSMGPSPEQLDQVAAARKAGNTPAMQEATKRRSEAESNIGSGAVEFAPGQFYKGPSRVTGTARKDSFSNRPGSVNLPPESSGGGTLSMMQGNEILPSNPRAKRDAMLEKAQQNAAIAQAEAAEESFKQNQSEEPKTPQEALLERALTNAWDKYQKDGDFEAFDQRIMMLTQIANRFNPEQPFLFGGQTSTPTEG